MRIGFVGLSKLEFCCEKNALLFGEGVVLNCLDRVKLKDSVERQFNCQFCCNRHSLLIERSLE